MAASDRHDSGIEGAKQSRIRRFVEEYLIDLNGTQAAIRAGYAPRGASVHAARMLARPSVQAAIDAAKARRTERTEITQDRVIRELARVAFGDSRRLMSWGPDGVVLSESSDLTDDEAAMVSEASETKTKDGGSIRLKTHDKMKALELIGRHLGMFPNKVDVAVPEGLAVRAVQVSAEEAREIAKEIGSKF